MDGDGGRTALEPEPVLVAVFTLGVLGLSKAESARTAPSGSTARVTGLATAGIAFALCAAATLYGLYLMIPQFHD